MAKSKRRWRLVWVVQSDDSDTMHPDLTHFMNNVHYESRENASAAYHRSDHHNLTGALTGFYVRSPRVYSPADFPLQLRSSVYQSWHDRERRKIVDGHYKPLPWAFKHWWLDRIQNPSLECAFHFAAVSKQDPTKLSYVPDAKHGENDRRLRIRPGRYLNRFFGDILSGDEIESMTCDFAGLNANDYELCFAVSPDEIEHVYRTGPNSCMSAPTDNYSSDEHPTRAYGAGDLAIAYIKRADRITARCVAWPEKKIFGLIYGDCARLRAGLEKKGYRRSNDGYEGARLLRIEQELRIEQDRDCLVAPYLDICPARARLDGEFLILDDDGSFCLESTSGLVSTNSFTCSHCDEDCSPEDTFHVRATPTHTERWCHYCTENDTFGCNYDGCLYSKSAVGYIHMANGQTWAQHNADEHAFECEGSGEWYPNDQAIRIMGHGGEMIVSQEWADDYNARTCEECGDTYVYDMVSRRPGGNGMDICDRCHESAQEAGPQDQPITPEPARAI